MYAMFLLGVVFAGSHHAFYTYLDGKLADDQIRMIRIGGVLSYAAKSSLAAAVIFAYRQQIWATFRRKVLRLRTIDSLFAATDDPLALVNWEFIKKAKVAVALAILTWLVTIISLFFFFFSCFLFFSSFFLFFSLSFSHFFAFSPFFCSLSAARAPFFYFLSL